jgi:diaminohydroxyphosphoribosylaminopyrimidine deaminase/5-amino-6-(5-phosphoribosylamino)uracil reductase
MLDLAARHALRGTGRVEPNPCVGAVIARGDEVVAIGHHRVFGGLHAEAEALASARARGVDVRGATMYVTLEPCAHFGKQPPCADAVIAAGIGEVVIAQADPNPVSAGGSVRLREAGIVVRYSDASPLAMHLAAPFLKRVRTKMPWVVAKWAQTIDGRIATRTGESKWISGDASRRRVHRVRSRMDAIVTGLGTVIADDPLLTVRGVPRPRRTPLRVVIDPTLEMAMDRALVRTAREAPTVAVCMRQIQNAAILAEKRAMLEGAGVRVVGVTGDMHWLDLREMLMRLAGEFDCTNVMIESGPGLLGSMLEQDLVDEAIVYIAPLVLGDAEAKAVAHGRVAKSLSEGRGFQLCRVRAVGGDVELVYRRAPNRWS